MQFERQTEPIEVSVVIPCLNEEDTLASCIEKARRALREHNIAGEIVVADNGSTIRLELSLSANKHKS